MKEKVINQFYINYPEFNNGNYNINIVETSRFNGNFEINLYKKDEIDGEFYYESCYWVKINQDGSIYIEKNVDVEVLRMRVSIDYDYCESVYFQPDEEHDYDQYENAIHKQHIERNEQRLRKMIAEKILNGEIPITSYECDCDSYDVPLSQVELFKLDS